MRLLEAVRPRGARRALVIILEESRTEGVAESALLSERAVAEDWNGPEEDSRVVAPAAGAVVRVRFPFSDLSQSMLRPAAVLVDAGPVSEFSGR